MYVTKENHSELFDDMIIKEILKNNAFGHLNVICLFEPKFDKGYDDKFKEGNLMDLIIKMYNDKLNELGIDWMFDKYDDKYGNTSLIIKRKRYYFMQKSLVENQFNLQKQTRK